MRWLVLLLGAMIVSAPAVFGQQEAPAELKNLWKSADKNEDGQIDRVEFHHVMTDVFFFIDADKDGGMTLVELQKVAPRVETNKFTAADRDGNKKLDMHEFQASVSDDFKDADKDKSGRIAVEEFNIMYKKP